MTLDMPKALAAMATCASPTEERETQQAPQWVPVDKGMLSRVLYANPVCLLTTCDAATSARNVMTITWLTPINNQGGFVCSMNGNRHSAQFVDHDGALFVLNVPVQGMEELVLSIGACSGASVDKFAQLNIATCTPGGDEAMLAGEGGGDSSKASTHKKQKLSKQEQHRQVVREAQRACVAVRDCVAHVLSRVDRVEHDDGHLLLRCTQLAAWCRAGYWDGKHFMPQRAELPPFLTFLGTKRFGYVRDAFE